MMLVVQHIGDTVYSLSTLAIIVHLEINFQFKSSVRHIMWKKTWEVNFLTYPCYVNEK